MPSRLITGLCIAMCASSAALAQTAAQIDALVRDEMAKQNIVGMAIAIVKNGAIAYAKGYGHTDLGRTQVVTTDTIFRWASVSKTLTAAATLKLAEENADIDLDDKVAKHVVYWPRFGTKGDIRIRHLLSNRSGIIHYKNKKHCRDNRSPNYERDRHTSKFYHAEQGVDVFERQPLCFPPGTDFKYSTFGFSLLGAAVEGASGQSYASWVSSNIQIPLGMSSLRQATGSRAGFDQRCHILRPVLAGNAAWKLPGSGWESNIIDLAKFANALLQGSLLDDTARLWTDVPGNPGYGYGVMHSPDGSRVWHRGRNENSRTGLYLYPESSDHLGIVLMINGVHSKDKRIAHHLADLFGRNNYDSRAPVVDECRDRCYGKLSVLWQQGDKDILLRRGYSSKHLLAEWTFLRQAGYYSNDIEPYLIGGEIYWDALFSKGTAENAIWLDLDDAHFAQKLHELSNTGLRPIDVESYKIGGKRRWAILFRHGSDTTISPNFSPGSREQAQD
ncbi:MAG: beta-lactamase family protein [Gammaproteobacteria bacterium]|nr:beta-lactamase family protein [Gammaproteobacteria bacterium]